LKKTAIIFKRDFNEIIKTKAFLILGTAFLALTAAAAVSTSIMLNRQEWIREAAARPLLELIIGLIAYFFPLLVLIAFIWGFSGPPVVKEKVNGNIASLMATPLSPREVWLGKSLAIFVPGYIISLISTIIIILTINLWAVVPATGDFVLPLPVFLLSLIWNPLLLLGTLLFIILFSLAGNPDLAIAPSFIVGFGLMMGIPLGMALGKIDLVSWSFSLWYMAGAIVVLVLTFLLTRFLTKENIVLSSKGN